MQTVISNIQENFKDLTFNESEHIYSIKGKPLKGSVSSLIKDFYEPFPEDAAVEMTIAKTGKSREEILQEWKENNEESKERGHRVHSFAERYPFDSSLIGTAQCPQEQAVEKFWRDKPEGIIPVSVELKMYHFKYLFPGTSDLLFYDTKNGYYIIADYKTNKDLFKNYKEKKMLSPFEDMLDSPYSHYTLQLSFYKILLEQLGIHVGRLLIIWLEMDGNYKMYDLKDCSEKLNTYLDANRRSYTKN